MRAGCDRATVHLVKNSKRAKPEFQNLGSSSNRWGSTDWQRHEETGIVLFSATARCGLGYTERHKCAT